MEICRWDEQSYEKKSADSFYKTAHTCYNEDINNDKIIINRFEFNIII